jgi:hypothetical protein
MRLRQALERRMRLAAVGRADVQRDAALQLARLDEAVRVALEGQLVVQVGQRVDLVDAVLPAVLCTDAGGLQLGQAVRCRAFGLQPRQQGLQVVRCPGVAARGQAGEVRDDLGRVGVRRHRPQRRLQRRLVAAAVEVPDGVGGHGQARRQRHAPRRLIRHRHRQRVLHRPGKFAGVARHAQMVQDRLAVQHQLARRGSGAHRVEVLDRPLDQRRFDPPAGPGAGGLLQQHEPLLIQVGLEARVVLGQVVGRLDHLRQRVAGLAHALQLGRGDVRRHAGDVAGVGQVQRGGGTRRAQCGRLGALFRVTQFGHGRRQERRRLYPLRSGRRAGTDNRP